jgi:hypothetical protein
MAIGASLEWCACVPARTIDQGANDALTSHR